MHQQAARLDEPQLAEGGLGRRVVRRRDAEVLGELTELTLLGRREPAVTADVTAAW